MAVTGRQAATVLGGPAADQTARASSPVLVGPASSARPGFFVEVQTTATVVRTHRDEQDDFSVLTSPRYPQCAAVAVAGEVQLGENQASGRDGRPGPSVASPVALSAPAGEQLSGLLVDSSLSDLSNSVPVQVESVVVGSGRLEAGLEAFAVGGPLPAGVVADSVSRLEERVAAGGRSAQV
jgi:hypothetical protein